MLADSIIPTSNDARLYILLTLAVVVISLVTAIVGLRTAVLTARRAARSSEEQATKIQEISVNVDGHLSEVVARVDQLTDTLNRAGVAVPLKDVKYFPSDPTAPSDSAQPATSALEA